MEILEAVAEYANKNHLNFLVYTSIQLKKFEGFFLIPKLFVRRLKFKYKYKYLYNYIINEPVSDTELATLYKHSKICLNIHVGTHAGMHTGPNPRTFESLACNSFQLIDTGHLKVTTLETKKHLVEFENKLDLCEKIHYYLEHSKERINIVDNGYQEVTKNYTVLNMLKTILQNTPFDIN